MVTAGKMTLAQWRVKSDEIHRLKLPDGTEFGVQIDRASSEKTAMRGRAIKDARAELLRIRILDFRNAKQLVTTNYGPTNSQHGFGGAGGANKVGMLGNPGIV